MQRADLQRSIANRTLDAAQITADASRPPRSNPNTNSDLWRSAHTTRLLVAITFHFNVDRLYYLVSVLRSLSTLRVSLKRVAIVTNTFIKDELTILRRSIDEILPSSEATIRVYGGLRHPFDLAWCHKEIMVREFLDDIRNNHYTHFLYLEDDIEFNSTHLVYFLKFRRLFHSIKLLPSFIRVEYSNTLRGIVSTDSIRATDVQKLPHVDLHDHIWVNMPNPYTGCFILDRQLAREYVNSRSFDYDDSYLVKKWPTRERAAMGLCFENVPQPFRSRYVVPISKQTGQAAQFSWISHLPNNYADNPTSLFGKVRMDSLFMGAVARKRHEQVRQKFYLMTAHGTLIAQNQRSELIQSYPGNSKIEDLVEVEEVDGGYYPVSSALAAFKIESSSSGIHFSKDGKYLCALRHSVRMVADRDLRRAWETFSPISGEQVHDLCDVHTMSAADRRVRASLLKIRVNRLTPR